MLLPCRFWVLLIILTCSGLMPLMGLPALTPLGPDVVFAQEPAKNFVVILTDDQRWDTLWAMPIVQRELVARGVVFTNAFVTTPLCCPTRASLLAGGFYAHSTGVLDNTLPNGGVVKFHDTLTLATLLQQAGYQTALVGKYLNGYFSMAPYIPPGWSQFVLTEVGDWFDYCTIRGRSGPSPTMGTMHRQRQYRTDFQRDQALQFLDHVGDAPFFLYFSPNAPHLPATPAPEDEGLFQNYKYRGRAYAEQNLQDKPEIIRKQGQKFHAMSMDATVREQLRSLQAVDRAVGAIVAKIATLGKLDQTVFIFTSDNGYHWGEHGLTAKSTPYEESIRVPFVVVIPGVQPRTEAQLVAINLDIAPTLLALAGIPTETEGRNLLPLLQTPATPWRTELLLEHFQSQWKWAGLRTREGTAEWKYVEYAETGERELYDLVNDPYEKTSRHTEAAYQPLLAQFAQRLEGQKGLTITTAALPKASVGHSYRVQLTAWGGQLPYTWRLAGRRLPAGLSLDSTTGIISGTPTQAEMREIPLQVTDASLTPVTGTPQAFIQRFVLLVSRGAQPGGTHDTSQHHSRRLSHRPQPVPLGANSGKNRLRAPSAHATTLRVTSLADPGTNGCDATECTLREAMAVARAGDTITFAARLFASGPQTLRLTAGELVIAHDLTIIGPGADRLTLHGNHTSRVWRINAGDVTLQGITIAGGDAVHSGGGLYNSGTLVLRQSIVRGNTACYNGGGLANDGSVTLLQSTVRGNAASNGGGLENGVAGRLALRSSAVHGNTAGLRGGGVVNSGALTLHRSTVHGNAAGTDGGGLYNTGSQVCTVSEHCHDVFASLQLQNSTVSKNTASTGGGLYIDRIGTVWLQNSTVSENTANTGGGLYIDRPDTLTLHSSIVAGNTVAPGGTTADCSGRLVSQGHNLVSTGTGCPVNSALQDRTVAPAAIFTQVLGPLRNNGGSTRTHALLPGSPATDAGDETRCPATDQRGIARPQGAGCDIGAYEAP